MFTGIVEEVGRIGSLERGRSSGRIEVACTGVVAEARVGDSISVNGCCLTVTRLLDGEGFAADLMGETLDRTALGSLRPGAPVNLERALRAGDPLGGHLVQGHVDAVATVTAVEPHERWTVMAFSLPAGLAPYLVEKGSVAVDGTSLTVMAVTEGSFSVGLIPHTLTATALRGRAVGDRVNIEVDIIAKYVERMLRAGVVSAYSPLGDPAKER